MTGRGSSVALPEGLVYEPAFMSEDEERRVVEVLAALEFSSVSMRGQVARRTVRHFGYDYDYTAWKVTPTQPLPDSLEWLRRRVAALAAVAAGELVQVLVSYYPPGAGIGWHRDAPMFGTIAGVSLLSDCRMRFQRQSSTGREVAAVVLERRSAYVLDGAVRNSWQHSIPATKADRYSITFRTLRNPERWRHPTE